MRVLLKCLIVMILTFVSCIPNFNPITDSSVRDVDLFLDMSVIHENCATLFDDDADANAFRATVYFYDADGDLKGKHIEVFDEYDRDTIAFVVPRIDMCEAYKMVVVGDFVYVNKYGDVIGKIIHHKPESAASLGVYRLITDCTLDTYCAYSVMSLSSHSCTYQLSLEPVFSYVYVKMTNASDVLMCKFQLKSKVIYDFLADTPTASVMTTSGIRYNDLEDNGYWILQYVPDRNDNVLDMELILARSMQNDTLNIRQYIGQQRIFSCLIDCETMKYNCY